MNYTAPHKILLAVIISATMLRAGPAMALAEAVGPVPTLSGAHLPITDSPYCISLLGAPGTKTFWMALPGVHLQARISKVQYY